MNSMELVNGWHLADGSECSLPYVAPVRGTAFGIPLPVSEGRAVLDIDGALSGADVFIGGQCVASVGERRALVDLSDRLSCGDTLEIRCVGGGVARSVRLHTAASDVYIPPYGVFVRTRSVGEETAELEVSVDVCNLGDKRRLAVETEAVYKNRRVGRRRKEFTFLGGNRTVTLPVGLRNVRRYTSGDPQLYTMFVRLTDEDGQTADVASVRFGICLHNGFSVSDKLVGCTLAHTGGVLGEASVRDMELRKFSALRDLGYNTVRYVGCPSDAALSVADELGFRVIVDLFDNWTHPRGNRDHVEFAYRRDEIAANAVKSLRNHPSVAMYSLGNAPEESYGRAGAENESRILSLVRALDPTRPVTAVLGELLPLKSELLRAGASEEEIAACATENALTALGRKYRLYAKATADFAAGLDLYAYAGTASPHTDKPMLIAAVTADDSARAIAEMRRDASVLGVLSDCGMDCVSRGLYREGDVDSTCLPRAAGLYRSVLLGNPSSFMTVSETENAPLSGAMHWNFGDGQKLFVNVFTSGDVVALYRNGELIGRKLAGRLSKYCTTFEIEYVPGTLEAVSFLRGRELCRTALETSGPPRSIRLMTGSRSIGASAGETAFLDVWTLDANGKIARTPATLAFEIEGEGEIVALGNEYGPSVSANGAETVNGHALVVVRGRRAGTLTVKATAAGMRYGRITVKVRE